MKATKKALRPMNVLGKGFGKTTIIPKRLSNALTLTPPGQVRKIEGHYKRLLERQSELFNQLIAKETTVVNDIYARSEISKKAFFIGRIAYTSSENIEDVIKSLEILLLEYAKTLQPIELGSLLLLSYPQLFYAPGYSNPLVQQSTVNLTRYYHFNKHSTFLAYDHIGFQPSLPFEAKKSIASHHDNHPVTRNEPIVYDSEVYCDDTGNIWSSEEIRAFQSQPQPIYERKGRKDIHGLMDRFLDFPSMLDNASDSDEMAGSEELDDE